MCEQCTGVLETTSHIFSECPGATELWTRVGITEDSIPHRHHWLIGTALPLPQEVHLDVIMLILRQIWKAHNALTFDKRATTTREVLQQVLDNLNSWQGCYKKQKTQLRAWREY
ncbi:hypothetical protein HU200_067718 [Digitaria exilis]|uniref:Reverse transcriptase zinc-binding domain-containing protein n=1 Tax=Digitaria exilis TaxID=1010633 RepID=A0A834ZZ30_9POAL|nr:hypothetical protein HU200_067718 [Digitaria exilis]